MLLLSPYGLYSYVFDLCFKMFCSIIKVYHYHPDLKYPEERENYELHWIFLIKLHYEIKNNPFNFFLNEYLIIQTKNRIN
jgi:hypothetical protein